MNVLDLLEFQTQIQACAVALEFPPAQPGVETLEAEDEFIGQTVVDSEIDPADNVPPSGGIDRAIRTILRRFLRRIEALLRLGQHELPTAHGKLSFQDPRLNVEFVLSCCGVLRKCSTKFSVGHLFGERQPQRRQTRIRDFIHDRLPSPTVRDRDFSAGPDILRKALNLTHSLPEEAATRSNSSPDVTNSALFD